MDKVFLAEGNAEQITISRGKEFQLGLTPAEVDKATALIGIALSMEELDPIPSKIENTPFVIRFFKDETLALERMDKDGSIPFKWGEADELILALHDGLKIARNERILVKGARGTGRTNINPEPFI